MTLFISNLESEMRDALRLIHSDNDQLSAAVKSVQIVREIIIRLRAFTRDNPFPDQQDEIRYFKYWGPRFYGRLFYYRKICDLGIARMHNSPERLETLLKKELQTIEDFYYRHEQLCKMYYLKDNSLDERIFIRNASENHFFDEVEVLMDQDFCVGCYFASRLYANQKLRRYLKHQLEAKNPLVTNDAPQLTWTDGKTDAGEIIIALYLSKSFNDGKAQLKEIVQWFEVRANIKVGNIHVLWQEIKRRKTGITKFLDRGRELLLNKAEDED
jgi:hypothetical protein